MSLQQNRRVSFSDMNRSLTVTNGNTGIGTTAPAHMLDVNGGMRSINFTTTSALITNVTTGTLNASTGITASSAQLTNINATTISAATAVATTYTGGSISLTGAVTAVTGTIGTFVATTSSAATVVATTYTGGSMSLSGNLAIGGTLTTVNITTTNISETNVSAGTVSATNIGVTTQTVGTSRITTSLLALGNSNTVGNIFTTGGNVGIATTSPAYTLDVNGSTRIQGSPLMLGNGTGGVALQLNDVSGAAWQLTTGDYKLSIGNGSIGSYTTRMTISSTGNVGVGTASPAYTLDINGSGLFRSGNNSGTFSNNQLQFGWQNTATYMHAIKTRHLGANTNDNAFDFYVWQTSDATTTVGTKHVMSVASQGVGVGTVNPGAQLSVSNDFTISANSGAWNSTAGKGIFMRYSTNGGQDGSYIQSIDRATAIVYPMTIQASTINLSTDANTTSRLFINASGNIGIGTSTPRSNLEITQSSSTTGVMLYSGLNDGGVNSIVFNHSDQSLLFRKVAIQTQALGSGQMARAHLGLCVNIANDNTNVTMSDAKLFIHGSSGNIGIGTTAPSGMLHLNNAALFTSAGNLTCTGDIISFGSLSDRRLKKNIETIETLKALDVVSKLRAVTFDWREDIFNESKRNTSDIGFIAQEVEELVPEAVSEYKEIETGEVYKNIKHERLVPYLLRAIQYLLKEREN